MSKNATESVKIVDIEVENIHNFWTTWWITLKISGKMWLLKLLKVAKNHGFTTSLKTMFLEKPQGGREVW